MARPPHLDGAGRAALLVPVLLLSGCAFSSVPAEPDSDDEAGVVPPAGMTEVVEPPADIPVLRSGGTPVTVLASDWRIGGSRVVATPGASPGWTHLPAEQVAAHPFVVQTDVDPMAVRARFFDSLDGDGVPGTEGDVHDCADGITAGAGCSFTMRADGLHITVDAPPSTEAVVVMAAWYVPAESRAASPHDPDANTASWGIRLDS